MWVAWHCSLPGMDNRDPFKDLTFDGRPAGYRDFRRKVILGVAGLEDKVQHLGVSGKVSPTLDVM